MIIQAAIDTHLVIRSSDLSPKVVQSLKDRFTRSNPKFYKNRSMGFYTGNLQKTVCAWEEEDGFLYLPRGAINDIKEVLSDAGLELVVRDRTMWPESVGHEFKGKLRPYQEEALERLISGGVLRGPPGAGKTVILLAAIVKMDRPAIVVVHNSALMDQWREAVEQWMGVAPGNVGGGRKLDIRTITIAMQQSLWKLSENVPGWVREFGVLAMDECAHVAAKTYQVVAEMFPARIRMGVSPDERRKDGMEWLTTDTLGPVVHQISKKDLIGLKQLVPVRMTVIPTGYVDELYLDTIRDGELPDWVSMIGRMVEDDDRNEKIMSVLREILGNKRSRVLVLCERVEACRLWVERLSVEGVKAGLMIGGAENRTTLNKTKAGLQAGRVRVGVGTTVADEGLDIPALSHVVLTCPGHQHPRKVEQQVGRAARPWEGKKSAEAVYFWDRDMFPAVEGEGRERAERKVLRALGSVVSEIRVVE